MQFTKKEIELAKRLKENRIKWHSEEGDWYFGEDGEVLLWAYNVIRTRDTWLPLLHQCREILGKAGYYFLLLSKGDNIQLDLWQKDTGNYICFFRGESDLEAIYQALLEVITNETINNE